MKDGARTRLLAVLVAAVGGFVVLAESALAAPGVLDRSFGAGGKVRLAELPSGYYDAVDVAVDGQGRVVFAGSSNRPDADVHGYTRFAVGRLTADGRRDRTFSGDGAVTFTFPRSGIGASAANGAFAVALTPRGRIVVAGLAKECIPEHRYCAFRAAVARLTANGTLDRRFGGDGRVIVRFPSGGDAVAYDVAVTRTGKIVVAGRVDDDFALARLQANGRLDRSFGERGVVVTDFSGWHDWVNALALQRDGKVVVAGLGGRDWAIARYRADGLLDRTFGGDGKVSVALGSDGGASDVAIQRDGKIVAVGTAMVDYEHDFGVVRYNRDGTPDRTFGARGRQTTTFVAPPNEVTAGSIEDAHAVALQPDGRILVVGDTYGYTPSAEDFAVVRYRPDGTLDRSFGRGGKAKADFRRSGDEALAAAVGPNGTLVLAGYSAERFAVARFRTE